MVTENPKFYVSSVLKLLLIVTGSIPVSVKYKQGQYIGVFLGFASFILSFHSMIWSVMNSQNLVILSESLSIFLIYISSFAMALVIILHRRILILTIECMDNESAHCKEVINTYFFKILKKVMKIILFYEVGYFITGVAFSSANDIELGTPESLYLPGYIPWRYDTPVKYTLSILYQCLTAFYPVLINYITIAALVCLYTYIDFKYKQLLRLIDDLQKHHMVIPFNREVEYHADLIQVIKSYQHWKRLSKELATYISDYCSTVIFCAILTSAWTVANVTDAETIISVKVKNSCVLFYMFTQLIIICFLGEYFLQTDSEIRKSLYNIPWYMNNSNESRSTIIGLMLLTQKTMQVKAYGMISVDANLFLHVLRIIYSVLNLYRNSYTMKSINR